MPRALLLRLSALLFAVALASTAGADTLLRLKAHQDPVEVAGQVRQEAIDTEVEVWIGDGRISRTDDATKLILTGDELVVANLERRTYSVLELPIDLDELLPPEARQMAEMMKIDATVTATGESREIGGWKTRGYEVTITNPAGMAVKIDLWATTDLDVDYAAYRRLASQMMAMQPGGETLLAEMEKIEGIPVLQTTTIDAGGAVVESSEELISSEKKEPPADAYEVPEGFERTEQPFSAPPGM